MTEVKQRATVTVKDAICFIAPDHVAGHVEPQTAGS
jgi:hypothetical protein